MEPFTKAVAWYQQSLEKLSKIEAVSFKTGTHVTTGPDIFCFQDMRYIMRDGECTSCIRSARRTSDCEGWEDPVTDDYVVEVAITELGEELRWKLLWNLRQESVSRWLTVLQAAPEQQRMRFIQTG